MNDPFNRTRPPRSTTREGRVELLAEVFDALLAGEMPGPEACAFVAGAGGAWLASGGNLERDYWRITQRGSHRTPQQIARALRHRR